MLKAMGYPNLHAGDAQTFRISAMFDTIVAGEVIEHLENPAQFLARAHEHLKPDGRLVLTTPYAFDFSTACTPCCDFLGRVSTPNTRCGSVR